MKAPATVIASPRYVDWLRAHAGALLEPTGVGVDEATKELAGLTAAIAFVEIDGPASSAAARLIEQICDQHPGLPVVALGASDQPAATLAAMRAGARDFLVPGRDDANVAAQIERLLRRVAIRGAGAGRVLALVAGHPGTGTAFLGAHLALASLENLHRPGDRALLLDLSLPAGAVSVFLNAHHEYGALNAIQDAYRCDQTLVDTAFSRHGSGLYVLGLPETQVGPPAVAATELAALLDVLRGLFALTIVAVDGASEAGVLRTALDAADRGVLLSEQSVLHSRYNQALLRSLRDAGCKLEHSGLVIDRYHRKHPLEPARLAALLQLPLLATLGGDAAAREQAMNAGEPLFSLAPRDEYAEAARTLARQLATRTTIAESAPRRGVLGRLLSG